MFRTLFVAAVAAALTVSAADMFSGTWKMNPAKSKYSPGPAPKSLTTKISMDGDWIVSVSDSVSADGKAANYTNRYKQDGKPYPYKTAVVDGTISVKRIDDHNSEATIKGSNGGTTTNKLVISKDGKTRTVTSNGTNAEGKAVSNVVVYDKQ